MSKDWDVTDPNGKTFTVTAPDGAKQDEVLKYAQQQFSGQKPDTQAPGEMGGAPGEIDAKVGGSQQITGSTQPKAYDPYHSLPNNFVGGISDIASGISQALTPPDPENPGGLDGLVSAVTGIAKAGMGAMRTVFSPIQAAGDAAGEVTGEAARSGAQSMGASPDVSAAIGTAVGAPINAAIQLWAAPYAIAKSAPTLMKAVQAGASRLPGAQVALRDMAAKAVEAWPSKFAPPRASKDIYAELEQMNPVLELPEYHKIAQKFAAKENVLAEFGVGNSVGSTAAKSANATAAQQATFTKTPGQGITGMTPPTGNLKEIPFDVVMDLRQRIGARIGELRAKGGEELGEYKQLFKGLTESLENAASNGAGAAFAKLKEANKAANREFSIGELQDIISKHVGNALEGTGVTSSNFAKALNDVNKLADKNPLFKKGLGDANFKTVIDNLEQFHQIKLRPPPKSTNYGSGLNIARGSAAYMGSKLLGASNETAMTVGASSVAIPWLVGKAVQSKAGTRALVDVLNRTGTVAPEHVAAIMSVIRGEQAIADGMPGEILKALKGKEMSIEEKIQAVNMQDTVIKDAGDGARALK